MANSFVTKHLRRTTRNLFLSHLTLLVVSGMLLFASGQVIPTMINGPRQLDTAGFESLLRQTGEIGEWVTIRGDRPTKVGEQIEQSDSGDERVTAHFLLVGVGERQLLVQAEPGDEGPVFSGKLGRMPSKDRADLNAALRDEPEVLRQITPLRLVATQNVWVQDGWLVVVLVLCVLLAMWKLTHAIRRFRDPAEHPSMRALARFGGIRANLKLIDDEAPQAQKMGKALLSASWLLYPAGYALHAVPYSEIIWFYKKVTTHYYVFIPVSKNIELIVHTRHSKQPLAMPVGRKQIDPLLETLHERAPWAMTGYDDDLLKAMMGPQRTELIKQVLERRQQAKTAA
jgi:hypothetical protein